MPNAHPVRAADTALLVVLRSLANSTKRLAQPAGFGQIALRAMREACEVKPKAIARTRHPGAACRALPACEGGSRHIWPPSSHLQEKTGADLVANCRSLVTIASSGVARGPARSVRRRRPTSIYTSAKRKCRRMSNAETGARRIAEASASSSSALASSSRPSRIDTPHAETNELKTKESLSGDSAQPRRMDTAAA